MSLCKVSFPVYKKYNFNNKIKITNFGGGKGNGNYKFIGYNGDNGKYSNDLLLYYPYRKKRQFNLV